jgi:hypothetical protein
MQSPSCMCVPPGPPPINFRMPISTAYFINPSHQSVSVCVSVLSLQGNGSVKCIPHFRARQRLDKHVSVATNAPNNRTIVGRAIFYAVMYYKTKVCGSVCVPLSLLGKNSVKTFLRQRRIFRASFSMRPVSYQRQVGDWFVQELHCTYSPYRFFKAKVVYHKEMYVTCHVPAFGAMSRFLQNRWNFIWASINERYY